MAAPRARESDWLDGQDLFLDIDSAYRAAQAMVTDGEREKKTGVVHKAWAFYGGVDPGIPVSEIEAMRVALKAAGKPSEIVIYPDTPHGFNADYRSKGFSSQGATECQAMRLVFGTSVERTVVTRNYRLTVANH